MFYTNVLLGATSRRKTVIPPPIPPSYVNGINFGVDRQPRVGLPFTLLMDGFVPSSSSTYDWSIVNSSTGTELFTSTLRNPTFTINEIGRFDVRVIVNNLNTLDRHQRAFATTIPQKVSELSANLVVDLSQIMDGKGTAFTNSCTVSVTNGSNTATSNLPHGVNVNDWIRLAKDKGAGFYQAQTGTTGTTLVLNKTYIGPTEIVPNASTRNFGVGSFNGAPENYTLDGDVIDIAGFPQTNLLDKLGVDTGVDVRIRPGYKIAFKGEFLGYFLMANWVGTATDPVHMFNVGKVSFYGYNGSLPYPIETNSKMQHIVFDGLADDDFSYGIELWGNPTRPGQLMFMNGRWNDDIICCGVEVMNTGVDTAAAFSYDPVFSAHNNTVQTGTNGSNQLVLASAITTIPASGRLVIHRTGGVYGSTTSDFYNYSSYNSGTRTFTLTTNLSQTYTPGLVVNVNICSDYNWYSTRVWYFNNFILPTNGGQDESFYIGFNNDANQTNGFRPFHLEQVKIYRNIVNSSGRDGCQPGGCRNLEVHDNLFYRSGLKNDFAHTSGISYNDGNTGWVFRNKFILSRDMAVIQTGRTGGTSHFFANIWDIKNWTIDGGTDIALFIAIETGSPSLIDYHLYYNTMVAAGKPLCIIQHNDASNSQSLSFTLAGNAIEQTGSQANYTEVKVNTSPAGGRSGWLIDNELRTTTDPNLFAWTDYANSDFSISNKASSLFGTGFNAAARFPSAPSWFFRDIDGYPIEVTRETVTDRTSGAKSAYEKWIEQDVTPPAISNFRVVNAFSNRLYFDMSELFDGSTVAGFSLSFSVGTPRTISSVVIDGAGGYFVLSGNIAIGDAFTVSYNGADGWHDISAAENELAAFSNAFVNNQRSRYNTSFHFDIGGAVSTNIDSHGHKYNNLATFNDGQTKNDIVDKDNIPWEGTLQIIDTMGSGSTGTIFDNGSGYGSGVDYDASVLRDGHSGGGVNIAKIEVTVNDDNGYTYNIESIGARAASGASRVTKFSIDQGANWIAYDASNNLNNKSRFTGVLPTAGKLHLWWQANNTTTGFGYVNGFTIERVEI